MTAEQASPAGRALVLGGGGLSGIAWETGILAGLAAGGADVTSADYVLGTSAGATVAAQIGSGLPVTDLFDRQTVPEAERRAVIAGRLPQHSWPSRKLAVVAVEAHTGDVRVFDKDSGADLVDAVTASCAIPGIWPPVTIGASRYVDGGTRSVVNADLAAGYQRVLILAPMADPSLDEQVAGLEAAGEQVQVQVITPDDESTAAFGLNPLDPAVRAPVARAGYAQGERAAAAVARLWQRPDFP